jgi:hypothetical protein
MSSTVTSPSLLAQVAFQVASGQQLTEQQRTMLGLHERVVALLHQTPQALNDVLLQSVGPNSAGRWCAN